MSDPVRVLVKRLDPELPLPAHAHRGDAGLDLYAAEPVTLKPGQRAAVRTGVALAIPEGFAGFVQPRSGLSLKHGLGKPNSPGLVDSGYRGEVLFIAINLDPDDLLVIQKGERIGQLVILEVPNVILEEVEELPASTRGTGGFGSTGR